MIWAYLSPIMSIFSRVKVLPGFFTLNESYN